MAKFNAVAVREVGVAEIAPNAQNRAGGFAYQSSPQMALYRQVAASLWSGDGYYEKQEEWLKRFQENVRAVMDIEPHFAFQLAAYARDKQGLKLRTSPLALYVEASTHLNAKGGMIRQYGPRVLLRADEPAEAIAYYRKFHGKNIPHGLLRGIGDALRGYNEYALGKYKDTGGVSLRDVLRLARPKPHDDAQRELWRKAVKRELATPYTWEVELSKAHGDDEKRATWNELIASGKLGVFALMRNIRNIIEAHADIESALAQITQERVLSSGILPFQWYKAYKAIESAGSREIASVMEQALVWSLSTIERLDGLTLVVADNSGSMSSVSQTNGLSNLELANLMGAMAVSVCRNGFAGTFGSTFEVSAAIPDNSIFRNKTLIDACGQRTGSSTDAWKIFEALTKRKKYVDRVIIFSDMQCYDSAQRSLTNTTYYHSLASELDSYMRAVNPNVRVYSVNLATQDNTCQFAPGQNVVELAGFSENVFGFMSAIEQDESVLDKIRSAY